MGLKLLVIDDDPANCRLLKAIFTPEGFEVIASHEADEGVARAAADRPSLVLLDLRLPNASGLDVLQALKEADPARPVILMTAHGEVKSAVRATQLGAFDYLTKPLDHDELLLTVRRALETQALQAEVEQLRLQVGEGAGLVRQMGPSLQVRQVAEQVRTVAATTFSVLILGETGAGKELVAQAVHRESDRRSRPFIALDCGAIPEALIESELFGHEKGSFTGADRKREGRFELAEGGTLFLDEVGNLPLALQAKLLRVLESRQLQAVGAARARAMDVRFIAATNDDLPQRAADGRFRADLYFRLAQYTISVPALRARVGDVGPLAQRFLEEASVELRLPMRPLTAEVLGVLERHPWPGNVRELRNVVRQAVLEAKGLTIARAQVQRLLGKPGSGQSAAPHTHGQSLKETAGAAAREAERQAITQALREAKGNKSHAARALTTDYKTLHVKMKQLGIRAKDFSA